MWILITAILRSWSTVFKSGLTAYIYHTNAVAALKGVSIEQNEMWKTANHDAEFNISALLAHKTIGKKFQRRLNIKGVQMKNKKITREISQTVKILINRIVKAGRLSVCVIQTKIWKEIVSTNLINAIVETKSPIIFNKGFNILCSRSKSHPWTADPEFNRRCSRCYGIMNFFALQLRMETPPHARNINIGWGCDSLLPQPIVCTWTFYIQDGNGQPAHISFDLTNNKFPLTTGLKLKR